MSKSISPSIGRRFIRGVVVVSHKSDQAFVDTEIIALFREKQLSVRQIHDKEIRMRLSTRQPLIGGLNEQKLVILVVSRNLIESGLTKNVSEALSSESRMRVVPIASDGDANAYITRDKTFTEFIDFSEGVEAGRTACRNLLKAFLDDRPNVRIGRNLRERLIEPRPKSPIGLPPIALPAACDSRVNAADRTVITRRPPSPKADSAHFSAFCPRTVTRGRAFVLEVFAYVLSDKRKVRSMRIHSLVEVSRKANVMLERSTDIVIQVHSKTLKIPENTDVLHWTGKIVNSQFEVEVPDAAYEGEHLGTIYILVNGIQKARFSFKVKVTRSKPDTRRGDWTYPRGRNGVIVKSIFVSYASQDRAEVIQWARGAMTAGADVFLDVLSLRAGDDWQTRLVEEIRRRQLFCLVWSEAASNSKWVEREWTQALKEKGCDFIQPVPLVDPAVVPPPLQLTECLHFNDTLRIIWEDAKRRRGGTNDH